MVGAVICFLHRNARLVFLTSGFAILILSGGVTLHALKGLLGA